MVCLLPRVFKASDVSIHTQSTQKCLYSEQNLHLNEVVLSRMKSKFDVYRYIECDGQD